MNLKSKMKNFVIAAFLTLSLLFQPVPTFAQATYSCGTYGSNAYATDTCNNSASANQGLWGRLSKTGMNALPYLLAGLLLVVGSAALYKLARNSANQK